MTPAEILALIAIAEQLGSMVISLTIQAKGQIEKSTELTDEERSSLTDRIKVAQDKVTSWV